MNRRRFLAYFTAFALFSLVVAACGGGGGGSGGGGGGGGNVQGAGVGKISDNTWVGKVAESDAYIVIMKTELNHLVFVTDGKEIALWFKGVVGVAGAGTFYLQDQDLHAINARVDGKNYTGLVTVAAGRHLAFTAVPAKGDAGLYRAKDGTGQSGWIVLEDGSFRGAKVSADGKAEGLATRAGVKWTDASAEP
jgi:hypothetical protein